MTMMNKLWLIFIISIALFGSDELEELDELEVVEHNFHEDNRFEPNRLKQQAKGETLGDYLEGETFIDNASFGPAVGRPVIKGMDSYRVGIVQGNGVLNDLSAMSQDHAVGIMASMSESIEWVKGASSLLYGAYSGGVIRSLGFENISYMWDKGIKGGIERSYANNSNQLSSSAKVVYGNEYLSLYMGGGYEKSSDYQIASGVNIEDSDMLNYNLHIVSGVKITDILRVKFFADSLNKSYAIPNDTDEETRIEMGQSRYGVVGFIDELGSLYGLHSELSTSEYLHYETEGGESDGLFYQNQIVLNSEASFDWFESSIKSKLDYLNTNLIVCHQHGQCTYNYVFNSDYVIGENWGSSLNSDGFQHTDPMPIVDEQQLALSWELENQSEENRFDIALRAEVRSVKTNVDISREDYSVSLLGGYVYDLVPNLLEFNIGYLERLPSTQELYWNGFHHATDTYILGNSDASNENSVNFDIAYTLKEEDWRVKMGGFYYYFFNYLYQSRMVDENGAVVNDPYHGADVWEISSKKAMIYGGAIEGSYTVLLGESKVVYSTTIEGLQGRLIDSGYIPRMPPLSVVFGLNYELGKFKSDLRYKIVDRARWLGESESATDGYDWLSVSIVYDFLWGDVKNSFWIKGENLTDSYARNHLSFLKSSAPLMGRLIRIGYSLTL